MTGTSTLDVGIVGVAGRGGSFSKAIDRAAGARVHAVCDIDAEAGQAAAAEFDGVEAYSDYDAMLWESDVDAVVLGTPQHYHVSQSIAALDRGVHVLSEVPAGVTYGECRDLVRAVRRSRATYMMAENYVYRRPVMIVKELVAAGRFGDLYYARGEYLHELKGLFQQTKWRRTWAAGRNGNNYPTHSLGPILSWMSDDRVTEVACSGSGHHHVDARGEQFEEEDTIEFLAKTERDRLITIRRDVMSERPHAMTNYQLQGTDGCFESARSEDGRDRVWLADHEEADRSSQYEWQTLDAIADEYEPDRWQTPPEGIEEFGHGGGDYFLMIDFLDSVENDEPPPIDVYRAMDMTLPGLASVESIRNDGAWVEVPDPRDW